MDVIIPTTTEIRSVCDTMDGLVTRFLDARTTLPPLGKFEADVEAMHLMYLSIRHIEAVTELARRDLVLVPAAMVLARAALENGHQSCVDDQTR